MSFTVVETAAHTSRWLDARPETMTEAMPRPYVTTPTSWDPEAYPAPRGPAHPQTHQQYDSQLPPPAGLVTGSHGGRRPSQLQPPRVGHAYQLTDMTSSIPQSSHPPPPPRFPSNYTASSTVGRQGHTMQPTLFSMQAGERMDHIQSYHMAHPSRVHSVSENQSPPFTHHEPPQSIDVRSIPRFTEYHLNTGITATGGGTSLNSPIVSPTEPRSDPMKISDLLGPGADGESRNSSISAISRRPGEIDAGYSLRIRQQPVAARSCGFGERDRRVIDPPPIVQLIIDGPNLTQEEISKKLRYCHYVMSCSILDETGAHDSSCMPEEYRQQRRLMGSLVGAPFVGKDEYGEEGCFFCFPDLSCRTPGAFRLKFSLVKIDPARAREVGRFPVLVEAKSEIFTVYTAKDFPGMQASTRLTKRLKEQGCIISIKKGNDRAKNARGHDDSSDGEQDEGEGSSQGKRRRRSAR
ncbi:hypothetical protein FSARC_8088 [Fusarium sarcochroum]|uniref:Velvet domain-containing protein n=1 Tax=Fusarium sarcochroum TaxID=1208366 RepID=A0A8H4TTZ8_9HYPO|nr:hypothetical protein FSARC_8088 [Fusarium sarcochroum]